MPGPEILDVGNDRRGREWRPPSGRQVLVLCLLLTVGLGIGASGTFWWQARVDERALASEAHLLGEPVMDGNETEPSAELCTTIDLRLVNTGRRPLRIETVALDLARLRTSPRCTHPRTTKPAEVAPLASTTWTIPVQLDCSRMEGRQEFQATVRTQSGERRTVTGQVGPYLPYLANCENAFVEWEITDADLVTRNGKRVLSITGTFQVAIRTLEVESLTGPEDSAFTVDVVAAPDEVGPAPAQAQLDVFVADCARAADLPAADLELAITTSPASVGSAVLDAGRADVTVKLIQLVDASCERTS